MTRKEIIEELERLYRIEELYYSLLADLGKIAKDTREKQKPFFKIYEEIILEYVMKIGKE
ncbi:MAG: hypothetical protein B6D55_04740 [Candidatus Omnitrophica bacterium 4484_70.2]|nr:MAG: hypothetical protein B6D55_04740 [Candidatus Omnitrophica bacterium 4484_70.2]